MPYDPIPSDELDEPVRGVFPIGEDVQTTARLLGHLDAAAYAFVMVPKAAHPIAKVVTDNWSLLEHRSGEKLMLITFQAPQQWAAAIVDKWRQRLGEDFEPAMARWKTAYGLDDGAAYDYLDYFQMDPPLEASDLPCLVIFCDKEDRRAIVQPIPDWTEDELMEFLEAVIDTINGHAADPAEVRLDNIARDLLSPSVTIQQKLGHLWGRTLDYVKKHPAVIVKVVLGIAAGAAAGGVPGAAIVSSVLTAAAGKGK